jgi:hypothetical protein
MLRFIGRTVGRFFGGIVWLALLAVLVALLLAFFLLCAASGLCLVWAAINGLLYLVSHHRDVGQQAFCFLIAGAVGFGVSVVILGAVWDAFRGARRRLSAQRS